MFLSDKADGEVQVAQQPSLAGFIAWLETRDPNETYDWTTYATCAVGQYSRAIGHWGMHDENYSRWSDIRALSLLAHFGCATSTLVGTFGACLAEARRVAAA